MKRRWIAVVWLALGGLAAAQSGDWAVNQHGKQVGTAHAQVGAQGPGFATSSVVNVELKGLKYALSKTEQLNGKHGIAHVDLSAAVNGQAVRVTAQPQGDKLALTIAANGRSTTTQLAQHPTAVMLADFDAGAWETLLAVAAAQNSRDLWVVIPKQAGSVEAVQLATYADEKGTLNGAAIPVHHRIATIAGAQTQLFVGPANQLLQAELPQAGFVLVRKGFVLTPPAKAPAATSGQN